MKARRMDGFTMVELVIVIAIMGILGGIVAVFIRLPVQAYSDSVGRAEVVDEADLALRRMARELRLALPNSIRINADGSAIEFLLTKTGGRYLAQEDAASATFNALDFVDATDVNVTVVGELRQPVVRGDYFVVYNLGAGLAPSDAWQFKNADRNIAQVVTGAAAGTASAVLALADNPFASQSVSMPSPSQRFQIVSGPVMFHCARASDGALVLTRYANYAIDATQTVPPAGTPLAAPLTRRASSCPGIFTYQSAASQRSALVNLTLELLPRGSDTTPVRLVHQVHVDNTP